MVDPQLTDYIKKAKQAGQADEQTKSLLRKNGWSEAEVNEAFASAAPSVSPNSYTPPQQPQVQRPQPEPQIQPQPQYQPQEQKSVAQSSMPRERKPGHLIMTLIIIFVVLAVIGGAGYFVVAQTNLLDNLMNMFSFSIEPPAGPIAGGEETDKQPESIVLETVNIAAIPEAYDASKVTIVGFSSAGDEAFYCAQAKVGNKISCFVNDEETESPYSYKPYWVETSPDGARTVFLYTDPVEKQSFTFENGEEGTRYDGTITMPKFSDDGKSFMYIVAGKDKKSFVVLDEWPFAPYDKIYGFPVLSSDNRYILYGARDGQDLLWVADEITE